MEPLLESERHATEHKSAKRPTAFFRCYAWNTTLNLSFYALAIVASLAYGKYQGACSTIVKVTVGVATYVGALVMCDLLYYVFQIKSISPDETWRHGYHMSVMFGGGTASQWRSDNGINFYDGDFSKSTEQAQQDKFEYAYKQLGLTRGMKVIDYGCSSQEWLSWLTARGVQVVGINTTETPITECLARVLDLASSDWNDIEGNAALKGEFYHKFDAMTFWDSAEDYASMKYGWDRNKHKKIWMQKFQLATHFLNPKSPCYKVWISCLHINKSSPTFLSYKRYIFSYLMDKSHIRTFPFVEELPDCAARQGLHLVHDKNCTMDYYMTSILCPEHGGQQTMQCSFRAALVIIWTCIVDPNWIPRLIWFYTPTWKFLFDPHNIDDSMVRLKWLIFEA